MSGGFEERDEYKGFRVKRLPLAYPDESDQERKKKPAKVSHDIDHRIHNRAGTKELEERMNSVALKYYYAEDGERKRALALEIMALSAQVFEIRLKNSRTSIGLDDAFMATLESTLRNFDPSVGEYSHYFKKTYTFRRQDGAEVWEEIDEHLAYVETKTDEGRERMRARLLADEAFVELFQLVEGFLAHKSSGARAPSRKRDLYTRLFFTETVTIVVKLKTAEADCESLEKHERDTVRCMELDFLETYMEAPCQTLKQIWSTKVKEECGVPDSGYGVVRGKAWRLAEWVFQNYLESAHGIIDSRNSVLNRRKEYRDTFMGEITALAH